MGINGERKRLWGFLKILNKYNILKVKSTGKINNIWRSFYNQSFCKAGHGCMFDHPDVDCETHIGRHGKCHILYTIPILGKNNLPL